MRYDEDVLAALELHDDGLKADYDVSVPLGCQGGLFGVHRAIRDSGNGK